MKNIIFLYTIIFGSQLSNRTGFCRALLGFTVTLSIFHLLIIQVVNKLLEKLPLKLYEFRNQWTIHKKCYKHRCELCLCPRVTCHIAWEIELTFTQNVFFVTFCKKSNSLFDITENQSIQKKWNFKLNLSKTLFLGDVIILCHSVRPKYSVQILLAPGIFKKMYHVLNIPVYYFFS